AFAGSRVARWPRRNPGQAASLATAAVATGGVGAAVAAGRSGKGTGSAEGLERYPPGETAEAAAGVPEGGQTGGSAGLTAARPRVPEASAADGTGREPPPPELPARQASAGGPP